jgi:hypothetical protein
MYGWQGSFCLEPFIKIKISYITASYRFHNIPKKAQRRKIDNTA